MADTNDDFMAALMGVPDGCWVIPGWDVHRVMRALEEAPEAGALSLGRELFKFDTFNGWVNHAQRAWKAEGVRPEVTICIDAKGRPCRIGRDFMKARDDGAFPVRVYLLRAEDDPAAKGIGASSGGKP